MAYPYQTPSSHWVPSAIMMLFLAAIPFVFAYKYYLKLSFSVCFGLVAATMLMAFEATNSRINVLKLQGEWSNHGAADIFIPTSCFLFYLFTAALVIRLFRAWFFNDLRNGQGRSGSEGAKAWTCSFPAGSARL